MRKKKPKPSSEENYTIFHALVEAMEDREKKRSKQSSLLQRFKLRK